MDVASLKLPSPRMMASVVLAAALLSGCGSGGGSAGTDGTGGTLSPDPPLNGACMVFPADNAWNRDVSADPVDPNSANYIANILKGSNQNLHADFGSNLTYGIPYAIVPGTQPKVPIDIVAYPSESDPGPYPVPADAPVEAGSDHHVLVIDRDNCILYEMFNARYIGPGWQCDSGAIFHFNSDALRPDGWTSASESDPGPYPVPADAPVEAGSDHHVLVIDRDNCILYEMFNARYIGPGWQCDSGAIFHFNSDALRPDGWTSADAAGLPIFPGLVRYEEVIEQGAIHHAVRFTVHQTQQGFIHPATHFASATNDPNDPPMGLRLRLKASYDISGFTGASKVILTALKKYGMLLADNGSDWYITGAADSRWDDNDLNQLKTVPGSEFEAVQSGPILH